MKKIRTSKMWGTEEEESVSHQGRGKVSAQQPRWGSVDCGEELK